MARHRVSAFLITLFLWLGAGVSPGGPSADAGLATRLGTSSRAKIQAPIRQDPTLAAGGLGAGVLGVTGWWRRRAWARREEERRRREIAEERERIARDLHDEFGAGLTRLVLLVERGRRAASGYTLHMTIRETGGRAG